MSLSDRIFDAIDKGFDLLFTKWGIGTTFAAAAGLIGVAIYMTYLDEQHWQEFADTHQCKVVSESRGRTGVGNTVTGSGQVGVTTVYIPGQTCYECNDEKVYCR